MGVVFEVWTLLAVVSCSRVWCDDVADVLNAMAKLGTFTAESMEFQKRLLGQGGLGQATHWPPQVGECWCVL